MKLLKEKSIPGRKAFEVPQCEFDSNIPEDMQRDSITLPEISEVDLIRHYTNLSKKNFGVDNGFYPLGSCTMKYNPKINEYLARLPDFNIHPLSKNNQGSLQMLFELEQFLSEITGMDATTLQPAAGSHGELTGVMLMKAYFESKNDKRTKMLIPDSAHGTNPASVAICGYDCVQVKSSKTGGVDIEDLREKMTEDVVGLMLTNPNTLGIFDENILEITKIVHDKGGLCYMDGANMNAMMGVVKPGDIGFDVLHLNLHKTFSTPHGGGGPGSGPVCVMNNLKKFLPGPLIKYNGTKYTIEDVDEESIGRVHSFWGNFGVMIKAYSYIRALGPKGLKKASQTAVLNANYMKEKLKGEFNLPYDRVCQHEFVLDDTLMPNGVTTNNIAKRLIDYGFHPPTVYFPLIVHGAIMIEPTETESKETMDLFIDAMIRIKKEAKDDPESVKSAPHNAPITKLDEVTAARKPKLNWN